MLQPRLTCIAATSKWGRARRCREGKARAALLGGLLMTFWGGTAAAQSGGGFDLSWSTIDGGGGVSMGANLVCAGTVGQTHTARLTGGPYQLSGGFWSGVSLGGVCVGDCNDDGQVTVDDLLIMVNIALGLAPFAECPAGDSSGDDMITIEDILIAVSNALNGCP